MDRSAKIFYKKSKAKMNRILFVYHASNIGGGTYCLLNILIFLDRTKYQPVVLLRSPGNLVNEIKKLNIEVYYFPNMRLFPYNKSILERGYFSTLIMRSLSYKKFRECVCKLKVNAVYFNTMMLAPYLKEAKQLGLKTCIHLREHWPIDDHKFQLGYLQKIINKYADEIVAINGYSASMVPLRDVTIVYDWVDMSNRYSDMPFNDIFEEDTAKYKIYLFTGGIQLVKGSYEIVKIFSERIKGSDKRLLIVGASEPAVTGIRDRVKYYLSKIGINSYEYKTFKEIRKDHRIKCIPAIYALGHLMQQAYCNLSYFTIPHANLALAESIIAGCIPVAARTPESIEYSMNGDLAVLFNLGDVEDLVRQLDYLDSHYVEIKNRIEINKDKIEKMFSPMANATRLNNVFDKIFKLKS